MSPARPVLGPLGLGFVFALAAMPVLQAETTPSPGLLDARVRTARYQPGQVYRLAGFVGYHIHVEFEPGEQFVGLGAGDIEGLAIQSQGAHLFLKPKAAHVATNLIVMTDRRLYLFEYSAESRRPDPRTDAVVYSLSFDYVLPVTRTIANKSVPELVPVKNFDYGYCGPRSLKPESVYDDGLKLHVRFPRRADWPAVFARNDDGTESLVNFTVEKDELIVHRVVAKFVLRRGRSVGCLINRSFGIDPGAAKPLAAPASMLTGTRP